MLKSLLISTFLFSILISFSQNITLQQKLQSNLDLQTQFQTLLAQSRNLESDYKMIRKSNIEIIQKNVNDSITKYTKEIATLKANSNSSSNEVNTLKDSLSNALSELTFEKSKTDNLTFLGINFDKGVYHTFVWTIITILALSLIIILATFRKTKVDANEHKKTAEESQLELQTFKKKAMETEQKLKRQLLDEQLKGSN